MLQDPANRFGLTVMDLERLALYLRRLEKKPVEAMSAGGGAEGSAVLIDTTRHSH